MPRGGGPRRIGGAGGSEDTLESASWTNRNPGEHEPALTSAEVAAAAMAMAATPSLLQPQLAVAQRE